MAGKSTKVSVGLEVDVTGTKDVDALARSIDAAAKAAKDDVKIAADVTGTADVADLVDTLDKVAASTPAKVAATVTGDAAVDTLVDDLAKVSASTTAKVAATVTGDAAVDTLVDDLAKVSASTTAKVAATVTGKDDIDTIAREIDDLPARTDVGVQVKASAPAGQSLKDVGEDIDHVKGKAGDLAVEGSAFGSQFLGSYSEGAGLFGDLAEQLSNLKKSADEVGGETGGGGFKGILSIAGGLGAGIIGGLLLDQVLGAFTKIEESQAAVAEAVETTSQAILDQGGFWSQTAALASVSAIEGSDTFKHLIASGESYTDVMEAMTSGAESVDKVNQLMAKHGESLSLRTQKEVSGLANVAGASKDAAKQKYAYLKANDLLTDSQKEAEASNRGAADGMDLVGDAARDAGHNIDYASGRVTVFNSKDIKDKKATLTATDNATPAVEKANKKKLDNKKNSLDSADHASPKVDSANRKDLKDKDSTLDATDYATGRVNTFNAKPISDKTATIDGDPRPAQGKIDGLDGQTVKVKVDFDVQSLNTDYRVSRVGSSSAPDGLSAPAMLGAAMAPRVAGGAGATLTAPVQIVVNGALDPASVARQIRQVLTRGERRTGPIRAGTGNGLRAPV